MATAPDPENPPGPAPYRAARRGHGCPVLVPVVVLALMGLVACKRSPGPTGPGKGPGASNAPVTAVIGVAARKDVPIYLDGLGTVQAFNTVTVRSRVDGQLQKLLFRDGQEVHAGDTLALIDPKPYESQVKQAKAKQAQDEALLVNANIQLKRDAELLANKVLAQADYDAQVAQANQLTAAVQADQAAVDSDQVQLDYCTIKAPIDGRTGIRQVDEGNILHANDSTGIVVLTQMRPISVVFTLPEQSLGSIQKQPAGPEMTVLAIDRDSRTVLDEGKLSVIDNQIDTGTGTIRLKATFPNKDLRLWPGQFVNVRLLLEIRKDGVVVPASVVQQGPEGAYAFVVNPNMTVKMSPLKVAQIDHDEALIESGLTPGDRVVVDGQYKLQPGSIVRPAGK